MRIALINGSPKVKRSSSRTLLDDLKEHLDANAEIQNYSFNSPTISEETIDELSKADVWVFAFPLYGDGIPGHLLSCLIQLEEACIQNTQIHIYGVVNCGFYEGIQNEYALKLLQNWCIKAGFVWGGGVGIGGGGGLAMMPKLEPGQGPKAPIDNALTGISNVILKKQTQENNYVSVAIPRFFYKLGAERGWRKAIKKNGGKVRDLKKTWND